MTDNAIVVTVDGTAYTFRPEEMTALLAGELRRSTGLTLSTLLEDEGDLDIEALAIIVWLARRQTGEVVTWETVAGGISYSSVIETDDEPAEGDPDSPEA